MIVFDTPLLEAIIASLGWTLLHFLWQGAVVGVLFGVSLACATHSTARTRYHIGLFYLALLGALPVVTFLWLSPAVNAVAVQAVASTLTVGAAAAASPDGADWRAFVDPYLPWTVLVWVFGVLLMTLRLLLEWRDVRRLTRLDIEPLSPQWQARIGKLRERMGVKRAVLVLRSARVHVPIVVGWLRPVILIPISTFTGLTPWQLELIVMHELAHVRRHDYLVNLLQVIVETLLFYHPVVRWVSRVVREEREHCCDDLVVARSGDALGYARALTELAGAQSMGLQTSVGSDGGKLMVRIKRLVIAHEPQRVSTHWTVGAMLAAFGMSVSSLLQPGAQHDPAFDAQPQIRARAMPAPPVIEAPAIDLVRDFVKSTAPVPTLAPPAEELAPVEPAARSGGGEAASIEPAPVSLQARMAPQNSAAPDTVASSSGAGPAVVSGSAAPQATQSAEATAPVEAPEAIAQESTGGSAIAPVEEEAAPRIARPVSGKNPEFPVGALLEGVEGWVKFNYTIGRDGTVRNVQIVEAQPRNVFELAVRRAVRSWRFEPALVAGEPVERDVTQTIQFSLGRASTDEEPCQHSTGTRLCRR